jgi:hypothetical protein
METDKTVKCRVCSGILDSGNFPAYPTLMQPVVINLSTSGYKQELDDLLRRGKVSNSLRDAMIVLLEKRSTKREHSYEDLPVVRPCLVSAVKVFTNMGMFMLDNKPYQLCILKARSEKKKPRLTMVYLESSIYRVYPI